jgi:transposase
MGVRKGQNYGTMLVDLERHAPVDVLPDASADSFAAWLKAHPGVELITRDRAAAFADGVALGAPKALQIADRWHILRNLSEARKSVLARHHETIKRAFTPKPEQQEPPPAPTPVVISHAERIHQSRRDRRLARYQEVRQSSEQGWSFASIARMLGMNPQDRGQVCPGRAVSRGPSSWGSSAQADALSLLSAKPVAGGRL